MTEQKNNVETTGSKELLAEIKDIIQSVLSESMDFEKKETEYDSDKPVLAETGKPPVKKDVFITASAKKEESSIQTEITHITEAIKMAQADKTLSYTNQKNDNDTVTEVNMQKESDIFLKWVGGISLFLAISVPIFYIIYRHLKKNRLI